VYILFHLGNRKRKKKDSVHVLVRKQKKEKSRNRITNDERKKKKHLHGRSIQSAEAVETTNLHQTKEGVYYMARLDLIVVVCWWSTHNFNLYSFFLPYPTSLVMAMIGCRREYTR
jgi:hypothetical protein